jgi:hypothetical protein
MQLGGLALGGFKLGTFFVYCEFAINLPKIVSSSTFATYSVMPVPIQGCSETVRPWTGDELLNDAVLSTLLQGLYVGYVYWRSVDQIHVWLRMYVNTGHFA